MIEKLLYPFGHPFDHTEIEPPKSRYVHDVLCECNSRKCFGYTPIRWRRELSIE